MPNARSGVPWAAGQNTKSGKVAKWQSGKVIRRPAGGMIDMADKLEPIRVFRDLLVWQRGMDLARAIYLETESMPRAEMFGLTSQMRRASCSIPMSIAEGFGKHSRQEFIRGLRVAMGSLVELMTAYELASSMGMLKQSDAVLNAMEEEDRLISSLIRKLQAKTAEERAARRNSRGE